MKLSLKNSSLFVLVFLFASACGQKTVTTTNNINSTTNASSTSSSNNSNSTSGSTISSCDGVIRSGATSCYYKNLPEIALNGPGTSGVTYWSSSADLANTGISQDQFRTDATFNVRMIPSYITDGRKSKQNRTCSQFTAKNFTKMKLAVMLTKSGVSVGQTIQLTASADSNGNWSYSNKGIFTVPAGTTDPLTLSVVGVQTNHRCTGMYGTAPTNCEFMDIPVVSNTSYPTECVGFRLEMSTDETFDLPN